jgi:hypothetical protein
MNFINTIKAIYEPKPEQKEYIVSHVATYYGNAELQTLSIEVTAAPEIIAELRKKLVSQAYTILAQSVEWDIKP